MSAGWRLYSQIIQVEIGDVIKPSARCNQAATPTVSPNKKTSDWANNRILISEMGFLVDFRPEMASERRARLTHVF